MYLPKQPYHNLPEFKALLAYWVKKYEPTMFTEHVLIETIAYNHWSMERERNRLNTLDAKPHIPFPESTRRLFEKNREKSEIAFWKAIQYFEQTRRTATPAPAKRSRKKTARKPLAMKPEDKATQWIEVRMLDNKCTTSLYPSNEDLQKKIDEQSKPPRLIVRRIDFLAGVPKEYSWTRPTAEQQTGVTSGRQLLSYEQWLHAAANEGTGHLSPASPFEFDQKV